MKVVLILVILLGLSLTSIVGNFGCGKSCPKDTKCVSNKCIADDDNKHDGYKYPHPRP